MLLKPSNYLLTALRMETIWIELCASQSGQSGTDYFRTIQSCKNSFAELLNFSLPELAKLYFYRLAHEEEQPALEPKVQIARVMPHVYLEELHFLKHPDVEFGFIDRIAEIKHGPHYWFCRYWKRGTGHGELRTVANSEATSADELFVFPSVPAKHVLATIKTMRGDYLK